MNKVILLGRLTKDCNTKYTQTGKCVTTFTWRSIDQLRKMENSRQTLCP